MTSDEYEAYFTQAAAEYAEDKVKAGNWPAEGAVERSRQEFVKYLPKGLETPDNDVCTLVDLESGAGVGMIWYARVAESTQPIWFIFDLSIDPEQRRQGYASQALAALEERARAEGIRSIELHVFGHNTAARALYEKVGFEITNINMVRKVS
ncbi:MAG TPA: GNAT family N-acetyltransferase [Bellilinea sp.]|nr:GNAT family N-acetyltransferase [Bellilinea sp.]